MNRVTKSTIWTCLLFVISICCIVSCSDSDSDDENIPGKEYYEYYKKQGYGNKSYESFYNLQHDDIDILMYDTWSRDTLVMGNGERKLLTGQSVEITKDNYYVEKNGEKTTRRHISSINVTSSGKLQFELEDGAMIEYDTFHWSVDHCAVTSTSSNGTYIDNRQHWANSTDVYKWCALNPPYIIN